MNSKSENPAKSHPITGAEFTSASAADTQALGRALGRKCIGSELIALCGTLGAGKTCFVQGLGSGLGIRRTINSPTFVLMKRYEGRLPLLHWDWYRLESEDDLDSAGFGDLQVERGVVVIEWADRFLDRLKGPFLKVEIEPVGAHTRQLFVRVEGRSAALSGAVESLKSWWAERKRNR